MSACGVCRTDLHLIDGDLPLHLTPLIPGHEIVGVVDRIGDDVQTLLPGMRVGVPWLGSVCGECRWCTSNRENLCDRAQFTGYDRQGGYAEWTVADERFCLPLPDCVEDVAAAPLLCAGLIGYRAWKMIGEAQRVGMYGFGAAAHLLTQLAVAEGRQVHAFTRPGDLATQKYALDLGAVWAGGSDARPTLLDAAIIFAPVGALIPAALATLEKAGTVVCAGIHMSEIPAFPYASLWQERTVRSVANLTRADGVEFLALLRQVVIRSKVHVFRLEEANHAVAALRQGEVQGAAVLIP